MGRLLLLALFIVTLVLLWKAFGPQTWGNAQQRRRGGVNRNNEVARNHKGPDDDPDFLWNIEKERFKQRRAQEAKEAEEAERQRRVERREELRRREQQEPEQHNPNQSNNDPEQE